MGRHTFKQTDILTNRQIKKQLRMPSIQFEQISIRTSCFHHLRNVNLELELGDRTWEQVEFDNNFHEMTKKKNEKNKKTKQNKKQNKIKNFKVKFPSSHHIVNFSLHWYVHSFFFYTFSSGKHFLFLSFLFSLLLNFYSHIIFCLISFISNIPLDFSPSNSLSLFLCSLTDKFFFYCSILSCFYFHCTTFCLCFAFTVLYFG